MANFVNIHNAIYAKDTIKKCFCNQNNEYRTEYNIIICTNETKHTHTFYEKEERDIAFLKLCLDLCRDN